MIYTPSQLMPIMSTLNPKFAATGTTCSLFIPKDTYQCDGCPFELGRHCGATFENPDWQASLDQLRLTYPELFI